MALQCFSTAPATGKRSIGHKLEYGRFHLNIRKDIVTRRMTERWNRLPGKTVESASSEIFKSSHDIFLGNLWVALVEQFLGHYELHLSHPSSGDSVIQKYFFIPQEGFTVFLVDYHPLNIICLEVQLTQLRNLCPFCKESA